MTFISSATGTRITNRHRKFTAAKKKARALAVKAVKMSDGDGQYYVENEETGRIESYRIPMPRRNPARRKTAKRKNAPKSQSKLLKNFTGVVRLNADKTVSIVGTGRKPNPSKKRRAKR